MMSRGWIQIPLESSLSTCRRFKNAPCGFPLFVYLGSMMDNVWSSR